jgi:hypothetical protein
MVMTEIAKIKRSELVEFNPERHRLTVAALEYGIEEAKPIKDWPALEEAVDLKIEEQRKFVAWWKASVSTGHGGDRQVPSTRHLSFRDAEDITGACTCSAPARVRSRQEATATRGQVPGAPDGDQRQGSRRRRMA